MGLLFGGVITSLLGWRWIFFINVPVAALAVTGAVIVIPKTLPDAGPRRRLDVPGAVTVTLGLGLVIYGFGEAQSTSWTIDPDARRLCFRAAVARRLLSSSSDARKSPFCRSGCFAGVRAVGERARGLPAVRRRDDCLSRPVVHAAGLGLLGAPCRRGDDPDADRIRDRCPGLEPPRRAARLASHHLDRLLLHRRWYRLADPAAGAPELHHDACPPDPHPLDRPRTRHRPDRALGDGGNPGERTKGSRQGFSTCPSNSAVPSGSPRSPPSLRRRRESGGGGHSQVRRTESMWRFSSPCACQSWPPASRSSRLRNPTPESGDR